MSASSLSPPARLFDASREMTLTVLAFDIPTNATAAAGSE